MQMPLLRGEQPLLIEPATHATQSWHDVPPVLFWYIPEAQALQCSGDAGSPLPYLPTSHATQNVLLIFA